MNKVNFSILIDYAHEPESLSQFLQTLASWRQNGYFDLVIHILSCDGLGRDDWKKPIMGSLSYKYVDFTILTTDNYGERDNPQEIVELLGKDFIDKDELLSKEWLNYHLNLEFDEEKEFRKTKKVKFLLEIDRKIAMKKSLQIAQFLVSNYDYLFLKKSNLQLTKGKIGTKILSEESINSNSKWSQISKVSDIADENSKNSPSNLNLEAEKDLETLKNEINLDEKKKKIGQEDGKIPKSENSTENIELEINNLNKNFDVNKEKEQILAEDYLESGLENEGNEENEHNILPKNSLQNRDLDTQIKNVESKNETETQTEIETMQKEKLAKSNNLEEKFDSDLEQNSHKKEGNEQEVEQNLDKKLKVLIVSTGVGYEPFLSQPGENLAWNEKEIWQEIWQEFAKTL